METSADETNIAHDNLYGLGELCMVYFNLRWWPMTRFIATLGVGEPLIKDEAWIRGPRRMQNTPMLPKDQRRRPENCRKTIAWLNKGSLFGFFWLRVAKNFNRAWLRF